MKLDYTKIVSSSTTNEITTSTNTELVDKVKLFPAHYTDKDFRSINFINFNDCTIEAVIDGITSTFVLKEYVGISIEDKRVNSFIIKESGVGYYFLGTL